MHASVSAARTRAATSAVAPALRVTGLTPVTAAAQVSLSPSQDSTAAITVRVRGDSTGTTVVESAIVRSGSTGARSDERGEATLRLPAGTRMIVATKLGYRPDSVSLSVRAGADTTVTITLIAQAVDVSAVIVAATRGERRVEGTLSEFETNLLIATEYMRNRVCALSLYCRHLDNSVQANALQAA